ncbi:HAD hydrolase-like protein [Vibrio hannami]|uniref:HAD hydrolase-like protein n=1 Tax=Vibrio hannami TaxID=2717094 RepID=UPI00240FC35F|nr:HAD hydrolase-like protein [Vibrio hannami]MDG3085667.1 HAD hydrolase-like protein [Vibrio hannami]
MNTNKNISCVIFDCDGVLVDSEKLCCQALSNVFNRFGLETSRSDFLAHFQGESLPIY